MIGLSAADITTCRITDFFTPQDRPVVEEVGIPTMLREGRWESELCFRHLTDPSRQAKLRWSIIALRDEFGGLIGAAVVTTDISACNQAEQALGDQHTLLVSVLEKLPLRVGIYSRSGNLIHSNQRMRDYRLGSRGRQRPNPLERYPNAGALLSEFPTRALDFAAWRAGSGAVDPDQRRPP